MNITQDGQKADNYFKEQYGTMDNPVMPKSMLLQDDMWPFAMQKTAFYNVKGILSQRKRYRFAIQNKAFEAT